MGKPWHQQRLGVSPLDVLELVRESVREGDFQLRAWDHNAVDYRGRSNKRLKITGAILLGVTDAKNVSYAEAKRAVIAAVIGRPPQEEEING